MVTHVTLLDISETLHAKFSTNRQFESISICNVLEITFFPVTVAPVFIYCRWHTADTRTPYTDYHYFNVRSTLWNDFAWVLLHIVRNNESIAGFNNLVDFFTSSCASNDPAI